MTIPRLVAMTSYWADFPPVHVLVAAYLGYENPHKNSNECEPVPSIGLSKCDFDGMLKRLGLPTEPDEKQVVGASKDSREFTVLTCREFGILNTGLGLPT